jgi:hypothetical protein
MGDRRYTASELRADVYRVLDSVLETGVPVEIERKGRVLKIVEDRPGSKLSKLVRRPYLQGQPEDIIHIDWSQDWRP